MRRQRMSGRLSVTYAVLLICIVGVASVLFYEYNRNIIYSEGISNLTQVSASAMLQLDNKLTTMDEVTVSVLADADFMANWQEYSKSGNRLVGNQVAIKRILTKAYANKSDIRRVTVFSLEGDYISTGEVSVTKNSVIRKLDHLKQNFDIANRMLINKHKDDWDTNSETDVISVIKPIKNRKAEIIGFIEIQQNVLYIETICDLTYNNSKLKVLVFTDSDDKPFYANFDAGDDDTRQIADRIKGYKKIRETDDAIFAMESSNFYQVKMVFILNKNALYKSLNSILRGIAVASICLILFTVTYILFVTHRIMQPINSLVMKMENADFDNFSHWEEHNIKDKETEILTNAFNEMLTRLKEAHERQSRLQDLHIKSIFSILQSETSPHFLYNSLFGIANLCEDGDNVAAAEACYSLTEIMRYSSNYADTKVSIYDEINNLNAYIKVMKSRYCERLHIVMETDELAYSFILPKLTYQPIVENAIKYSLVHQDIVKIRVSTKMTENKVIIQFDDNGCGISEEIRNAIKEKVEKFLSGEEDVCREVQFGGMGLGGTIIRLSIFFGNRFNYEISDNRDGGATVAFEIEYNGGGAVFVQGAVGG